jgi:preprotein translocase subunit SecF
LLVRMKSDMSGTFIDAEGTAANVGDAIVQTLRAATPDIQIDLMRSEIIGAQMGEEMIFNGVLGVLAAFFGIFVYVAVRFQRKFAAVALIALVHDVVIVLGLFSMIQLEVDLTVLAAGLAVIGYSINDTVVVADRIRENFLTMRKASAVDIINISLTQTLGRTLMTSGTSLMVLIALFLVGGDMIHNFSIALTVGIAVGTYSSIYVAAAVMLWLNLTKEDLVLPVKEGAEQDELR